MELFKSTLQHCPEILLFLSIAIGFWIGKFQIGTIQLGGVAGALLIAVLLSVFGVSVDSGVKAILFALFIYAVGFESGPQFFKSLGPESIKEVLLALFMAISGLMTVWFVAKFFHLDKGLAAGLAAGGMTQSAIMGTASDALSRLDLPLIEIQRLQANIAVGYAMTYVFGSLGAIIVCANVLPKFMQREIHDDALLAQSDLLNGAIELAPRQAMAMPEIVGRIYRVDAADGQSIQEIESRAQCLNTVNTITIEKLKRDGHLIDITPGTILKSNDVVLVVGRVKSVVASAAYIGQELQSSVGMELVMETTEVILKNSRYIGRSLGDLVRNTPPYLKHGIYILSIHHKGALVEYHEDFVFHYGDIITIYGTQSDLRRVIKEGGKILPLSLKTDWATHAAGIALGLIIGLLTVHIGGIPLTLGAGGGALLSGLLFGWMHSRNQLNGNMPAAAAQLLKDFGLAGFVAAVGLQSGLQAIQTVKDSGFSLFLLGVIVTLLPLLLSMLFARYILKYNNVAVFAGALAGARSANPAFGAVLDKAGNSIPTVAFAITYALANVFLTLLGPIIVGLV